MSSNEWVKFNQLVVAANLLNYVIPWHRYWNWLSKGWENKNEQWNLRRRKVNSLNFSFRNPREPTSMWREVTNIWREVTNTSSKVKRTWREVMGIWRQVTKALLRVSVSDLRIWVSDVRLRLFDVSVRVLDVRSLGSRFQKN